ncbi:hypothetical protein KAK06_18675 [Ideonella sp. 4Y11]|uniref:Uncharacterized protein n=1 Tax=Ideonella aquatica TaxID=2824119 RepID=A0A941BL06_9BURK|nr:hypothetical protein [Ideonella aquatica]MBQ0960987.1 hypothetical protein [Ideonella aquatica]
MPCHLHALLPPTALVLGLTASLAQAQQVGTYEGLTDAGDSLTIKVEHDEFGQPRVHEVGIGYIASCTKSGPGRWVGWGAGVSQSIVARKASFEVRGNALYQSWTLKFNGAGDQISGSFLGRTPEFVDLDSSTKQVQLCDSGKRSFTASLVPMATAGAPALRRGEQRALPR